MTKAREPLSIADAVTEIAKVITWEKAAEVVDKSVRLIAYWSDPEDDRAPSLAQALALDAAYRAVTGGDYAPIQSAYAYQLDLLQAPVGNRAALRQLVGEVARETGEAVCALVQASEDSAGPAAIKDAIREVDEAAEVIGRARAALIVPFPKAVGQ